ncbi:DNA primase [Wolbachia endosymbiont of Diaphorina citri]|jgi:DNA primase, catalytic core|uniref:DNA primase n=1 Tax=Wolbachia endosymbiont of Diaphorina citri TaxID=116598 RepID=UPI00036FA9BF|nr:DNA primase [Wolbachia endosymbiont of Diaphorina citri]QJT93990.1 DNA primase [Wolbachia endosymbiont of Diaphorina citri]QJT95231.1 DNA primase [Wolbachia endosymbiont of Diaphorina citri]QJT96477.1 DNA primase [Wolbachia endosymbiont of Diaphorina citri]QLK10887.1 DNA primase [Wolbachia endosymbiont of Diaphorina citri]QXY86557.1 DNA primase [Wolbachia endosymbiont of Diaphorina citri]
MDHIDIIKSKLLLSDIVGKKVRLIKRGDSFVGLCPFHNEKTPSFSVSNIKGLYYCFGCSAHGDAFEFISQTEGLSFKEALEKLASLAGIELPKNLSFAKENDKLFSALNLAANWFTQKNQGVVDYLKQRKISPKIIDKFRIGYAPSSGLKEYLNSSGIKDEILIDVGLINKNSRDYFYDRLIFPIHNITGKVIGFGGRALNSEQQPKYLNSPESQLFKKRENLYGLNFALSEIRKKQHLFVVEGYMDVIALHQAGISNTVAPLGTAISAEQIKNLWKLAKEISICMDGDSPGCHAAIRIAELVLPILEPGYTLKFVTLPSNKDPYDICNELEYKTEDVLSAFNRSTELHSEYLWHHIIGSNLQNYEKFAPEKYSILEHKFMEYVNAISNISIKRYYRDYFYKKVNELRSSFKKQIFKSRLRETKGEYLYDKSPELIEAEQNQAITLRIVIEFPELLNQPIFFEQFSHFEFTNTKMKGLQQRIIDLTNNLSELSKKVLLQELEQLDVIKFILEKTNVLSSQLNERKSAETVLNNIVLQKELNVLQEEKIKARLGGNFDLEERLIEQIKQIEDSIQEMQMEFIQK